MGGSTAHLSGSESQPVTCSCMALNKGLKFAGPQLLIRELGMIHRVLRGLSESFIEH